jgi:serine/threonine-protein kinase
MDPPNTDPIARLNAALEGRYRIESELGEGGMATVYLADDLKHERKVALKVLKPELAAVVGAERFLAEIKTTANLQHPHVLPLFDSGEADGFLFYVMPYVEGETLRARLERERQIPVDEAVRITSDVAEALHHAHQHGVIHRDIKPANILLSSGRPLVADFGIAFAVSTAGGGRLTETGLSMGTPYYMSPEQASADQSPRASSDVYSLGCVLYEMLVGEPPFTGSSAQAVLAKILTAEAPSAARARASIPPNVDAAIRKAIERLPADRFKGAQGFSEALRDPAFEHGTVGSTQPLPTPTRRGVLWPAVTAVAVLLAGWSWFRPTPPEPVSRYEIVMSPVPVSTGALNSPLLDVSPSGDAIAFLARPEEGGAWNLWFRKRGELEATPIGGTDHARTPRFSPDGRSLVYAGPDGLRTVGVDGGGSTLISSEVSSLAGVAWGDDGYIYVAGAEGLRRLPESGGPLEDVWVSQGETPVDFRWPDVLPGSRGVVVAERGGGEGRISLIDLDSGERQVVGEGIQARFAHSGHLLVATLDGTLLARTFDPRTFRAGPAATVLEGLNVQPSGFIDMGISDRGWLVYLSGFTSQDAVDEAVWVSRRGVVTPVDGGWRFSSSGNSGWALSPAGDQLAIKLNAEGGQDIWVRNLAGAGLRRLTFDDALDQRPRWHPDGRSVTFVSARGGNMDLYSRRVDGVGVAELLMDLPDPILEATWSRDGQWLLARTGGSEVSGANVRDVWAKRFQGDTATFRLLTGEADERAVSVSPDGGWLAYESNETGSDEVYVRPFPEVDAGQWQISLSGGSAPLWAHSGRELFYMNTRGELVAADLSSGPSNIENREVLFSLEGFRQSTNYTWFDVHPDDQRFLMVRESDRLEAPIVVENFFSVIEARVPR